MILRAAGLNCTASRVPCRRADPVIWKRPPVQRIEASGDKCQEKEKMCGTSPIKRKMFLPPGHRTSALLKWPASSTRASPRFSPSNALGEAVRSCVFFSKCKSPETAGSTCAHGSNCFTFHEFMRVFSKPPLGLQHPQTNGHLVFELHFTQQFADQEYAA